MAVLLIKVQFIAVVTSNIAPPQPAVLPMKVQLIIIIFLAPLFQIAPPHILVSSKLVVVPINPFKKFIFLNVTMALLVI